MTPDDFGLIESWRQRPHVRKWWGDDEKLDEEELAHPLVRRWLVCQYNKPFAYIQDYAVQGWDFDHYFAHLPKGARGIDQYIGEPHKIGLGHGSALITQHVQTLFKEGVPVVATDPDPKNTVAIAVYQKVGFQIFGAVIASDWGPVLPMKIEA